MAKAPRFSLVTLLARSSDPELAFLGASKPRKGATTSRGERRERPRAGAWPPGWMGRARPQENEGPPASTPSARSLGEVSSRYREPVCKSV